MYKSCVHSSILDINREAWNACFAGELEDYDYYLTVDQAGIKGFERFYLTIMEGSTIMAATSGFITKYELDTTLQGALKKGVNVIKKIIPQFLTLRLCCIGAPETECGQLGFHSNVSENMRQTLLHELMQAFERIAKQRGIKLLGVKDAQDNQRLLWDYCLNPRGYKRINSLPTGILTLAENNTFDDYLMSLSKATRKDMRRKLKAAEHIQIEETQTLGELTPQLMEFYYDTKNRSDWQFEELTAEYFTGALATMQNRALCFVYYANGQAIAFNLVLLNEHKMIDKFFCMKAEQGKEYNLYFISWLHNVRYCLERGITTYQSGQAGYETKLRLGSHLVPNFLYFKHRNYLLNSLLKLASPLFEAEVPNHA